MLPPESSLRAHPGDQRGDAGRVARHRDRGDDVLADRLLNFHALHVDDRRFAGDRDRLFEGADFQVAVDGGDEGASQLDAVALDGAEARQREGDRVGAGTEIDDAVLAGVVADDRADFFNQHRAGRFNRYAGKHATGGVLDDAGNGGLREGCGR